MTDDGTPRTAAGRRAVDWWEGHESFVDSEIEGGFRGAILAIEAEARALVTPDSAPEVEIEAAWEALKRDLDELAADPRSRHYTTDYHRPIIEAAIRAQGGGLDVERLAQVCIDLGFRIDAPGGQYMFAAEHRAAAQIIERYARLSEADHAD